jgi:hypothetical protein
MNMDDKKPESRTTAAEAIGSTGGDAVPDVAKEAKPALSFTLARFAGQPEPR